ncbi:MAG TPA: SDR family NAD(P)-dependent oxidoreductase [Stellaceae bacterium]|nr:SDR family NAD(P)-dependent oxidoreductase [Stellaceae bacterium]
MEGSLRGKVALITGGSRGIGRGIALELGARGCHVVLTARDRAALESVAAEIRARGGDASVYAADLCPEAAADALVETVKRDTGRLDILVNNAGAVKRGSFFTLAERDWQDGFALKFFAHVRLSRSLWPLLKQSGGSVVFISGIGARAPVADYMIGASVIGASLAFMRALADIGKEDGVQVLAINPGSVETDRFRHRLAIIMKSTGLDEATARERHRRELEITRFGTPEDVAALVAFVVSPRGRWLHGTAIDIDGGQWNPLRMAKYDQPAAAIHDDEARSPGE